MNPRPTFIPAGNYGSAALSAAASAASPTTLSGPAPSFAEQIAALEALRPALTIEQCAGKWIGANGQPVPGLTEEDQRRFNRAQIRGASADAYARKAVA